MDGIKWLDLLHQFSTLQLLYASQDFAWPVVLAPEDINAKRVAEVLPSLDLIYLEGEPVSSLAKFVAACQIFGHPVIVTEPKEFNRRLKSSVSK